LDGLAKALKKPVPKGLQELLTWHNGQGEDYVGYFQDHWLLMSAARIVTAKAELDESGADQGWHKEWVPFLEDDGGNFMCLDTSGKEPGVVVFWAGAEPEKKADSLGAWLTDFVGQVEAGHYHEDPERGTFRPSKKK